MLSNSSRGTLMSYTDHSVQRRFKSNTPIIISDAVYTGCCTARQFSDRELLPRSIYDVLTQISNDFQWSLYRVQCRQTLAVVARLV